MTTSDLGAFRLSISYEGERVVVGVQGDLDVLTAPTLGRVVTALVDLGHAEVVVNLARLEFLGAAGLNVILAAATRVATEGGALHVRSLPARSRRLFEVTGADRLVVDEVPTSQATEQAGDQEWDLSGEVAAMLSSADPTDVRMGRRVRAALQAREVIGQAQGLLMERHNASAAEAAGMLRRLARKAGSPVPVFATELLATSEDGPVQSPGTAG